MDLKLRVGIDVGCRAHQLASHTLIVRSLGDIVFGKGLTTSSQVRSWQGDRWKDGFQGET